MKCLAVIALVLASGIAEGTDAGSKANPLGTTIALMDTLTAKIVAEGEAEAKAYNEYFEWCDDTSKNAQFEIKTATSEKEELEATIGELSSSISASTTKIEELSGSIAADTAELK